MKTFTAIFLVSVFCLQEIWTLTTPLEYGAMVDTQNEMVEKPDELVDDQSG